MKRLKTVIIYVSILLIAAFVIIQLNKLVEKTGLRTDQINEHYYERL